MGVIKWLVVLVLLSGGTGLAYQASVKGWGLPGLLDEPVSIRQESQDRRRSGGVGFFYFGSRRHYGAGFQGGK